VFGCGNGWLFWKQRVEFNQYSFLTARCICIERYLLPCTGRAGGRADGAIEITRERCEIDEFDRSKISDGRCVRKFGFYTYLSLSWTDFDGSWLSAILETLIIASATWFFDWVGLPGTPGSWFSRNRSFFNMADWNRNRLPLHRAVYSAIAELLYYKLTYRYCGQTD
jgi:hypothetical protein